MSTEQLIRHLVVEDGVPPERTFEALRALLDDTTVEASAPPRGIAEAAGIVGLPASTLRYYEREGLVDPPRDRGGRRAYAPEHLRRLVFCARMRLSGMGMEDLKRYIALVDEGDSTVGQRREIMLAHRARVVRQQRELDLALAATDYKIAVYGGVPAP